MTTQPTVGALETQEARLLGDRPRDHARRAAGARRSLAGRRPARQGRLGERHKATAQKVVDALVATMHWINTHCATDIANKLPQDFVQNSTITQGAVHRRADHRQGSVPARRHHARRRPEGRSSPWRSDRRRHVSKVTLANTFTNKYATRRTSSRASRPRRRRRAPTADRTPTGGPVRHSPGGSSVAHGFARLPREDRSTHVGRDAGGDVGRGVDEPLQSDAIESGRRRTRLRRRADPA